MQVFPLYEMKVTNSKNFNLLILYGLTLLSPGVFYIFLIAMDFPYFFRKTDLSDIRNVLIINKIRD